MERNNYKSLLCYSQTSQFLPTDIQHNELEYFYSVRGSRKVAVRGYAYTLDRMGKFGDKYLRCDRRAIHCKGKLKINTENNVIAIRNHNHAPDDSRMQVPLGSYLMIGANS